MSAGFFITGTDTNVGKTVLSALLVAALDALYWKPIQTGASEDTDRRSVIRWAGVCDKRTLPECYLFDPPVSPHLAAAACGTTIDLARLRASFAPSKVPVIVEGAGGILAPINDKQTMLDVAGTLRMPLIVATRTVVGTINHTTLTVNAIRDAGLHVAGVVMIGDESKDNERSIEHFAAVPIVGRIPFLPAIGREALLQVFETNFNHSVFTRTHVQ